MDSKAFFKLNYGVYIVSSSADGKDGGCVINTMAQVTSSPARLSIALNKNNHTLKLIETSGTFSGVVLSDNGDMDLIKRFGFQSGRDVNKYDGLPQGRDGLHNPYPTQGVCARFACRVISTLDVGTHVIVIGEVEEAEVMDEKTPGFCLPISHLRQLSCKEKRFHASKRAFLPGKCRQDRGVPLHCLRLYPGIRYPAR